MRYFRFEVPDKIVNLYGLPCWHIGASQSSQKFIDYLIGVILRDPYAFAIYMGDGGECVTKTSKGNIYEQTLSPGDQLRVAAELLKKLGEKLKFGIRGNHGNRIDKDCGLGWDETLCARVGIPYLGVAAFGEVVLKGDGARKNAFSLYVHHGSSGSISPAGKMSATHKPGNLVLCDVALTAHHHGCGEAWPHRMIAEVNPRTSSIEYRAMRMYACGSAYDSRDGYAEEKMYPVITPMAIVVSVSSSKGGIQVSHSVLDGSSPEFVSDHMRQKWTERS